MTTRAPVGHWLIVGLAALAFLLSAAINGPAQSRTDQIAGHDVLRAIDTGALRGWLLNLDPSALVFQDSLGRFWIDAGFGLNIYDEKTDRWTPRSFAFGKLGQIKAVDQIAEDGRRSIWVEYGLLGKLAFYNDGEWHEAADVRPAGIASLGHSLIGGEKGEVWFVSTGGLLGYDGQRWDGPFNPPGPIIREFNKPKSRGTVNESGNELESAARGKRDRSSRSEQFRWTSGFWRGTQDRDGEVWLASDSAVLRFDQRDRRWKIYTARAFGMRVSNVFEDMGGKLWFWGDSGRVAEYDKSVNKWTYRDLTHAYLHMNGSISAVSVDREGNVIIGTSAGNLVIDQKTGELDALTLPGTRPPTIRRAKLHPVWTSRFARDYQIRSISVDKEGRIWMGSRDQIFILKP